MAEEERSEEEMNNLFQEICCPWCHSVDVKQFETSKYHCTSCKQYFFNWSKPKKEYKKIAVPDYFHICTNCGGRNTKFLEEETYECYDCGETYSVSEKARKDHEIMATHEILNWIQNNNAIIHIEQGPEAFKEICENGGSEALEECNVEKEGEDGYWVEVALNDDCAGWSYKRNLVDAIKDAFYAMIGYALEIGYVSFYPYTIPVLLPLKEIPENLREANSWIRQSRFNFETHKIEYNGIDYNKENG